MISEESTTAANTARSTPRRTARAVGRLTGLADLVGALRNLGLIQFGRLDRERIGYFAADDGHLIPVQALGSGPPIVLVHGLGCSHKHWMRVARRLARNHRVYAWDARGHGQSAARSSTHATLGRLGQDLHNLIEFFRLDRVVLVGHSMGALTVMQYLQEYGSGRVAAAGFVDQSPRIVTDDAWSLGLFGGCSESMLSGLIAGARSNLAETVLHEIEAALVGRFGSRFGRWLAPEATIGRFLRSWLRGIEVAPLLALCESLAGADFRPLIKKLELPVFVALGGRSAHYAGLPLDDYYRSTLAYSQIVTYARAGHSPHYAEPARFARDLAAFIKGVAR